MKRVRKKYKPPFCAFGDDSMYRDVLVYSFAVFHRKNLPKAKEALKRIRKSHQIPIDTPIHCRILFSGDQRTKANLGHLSPARVKVLISQIIDEMNKVPCLLRYAYCNLPKSEEIFLKGKGAIVVHDEPKGVLGVLSQACFLPIKNQPYIPGPEQYEIFSSRDETKINFIGRQRRRADAYSSGISIEMERNKGRVRIPFNVGEHELQQVADVYAYICSHALSKECKDDFFRNQLNKVRYSTQAIGFPDSRFEEAGLSRTNNT
jgi:hypothetical protein